MNSCHVCLTPTPQGRAFCSTHWGYLDPDLQRVFMAAAKALRQARAEWSHYNDPNGERLRAAQVAYRTVRSQAATDIRLAMATADKEAGNA